jgi:hypothetical protein
MLLDIRDDDPLLAIGRRTAGAHAIADGDAVDGPVVEIGQAGRRPLLQMPALGIEQTSKLLKILQKIMD